jgi:hypothetical protein
VGNQTFYSDYYIEPSLIDPNGTKLAETIIYVAVDKAYTSSRLVNIGPTGIAAFSGPFKDSYLVCGKNWSDVRSVIKSNGYQPMFLAVYNPFDIDGSHYEQQHRLTTTSVSKSSTSFSSSSSSYIDALECTIFAPSSLLTERSDTGFASLEKTHVPQNQVGEL